MLGDKNEYGMLSQTLTPPVSVPYLLSLTEAAEYSANTTECCDDAY